MSFNFGKDHHTKLPPVYQIRVKGQLDARWADWFEGLSVSADASGNSLITGPVVDQAALYSILKKIRDLGIPLLSINQIGNDPANPPGSDR